MPLSCFETPQDALRAIEAACQSRLLTLVLAHSTGKALVNVWTKECCYI